MRLSKRDECQMLSKRINGTHVSSFCQSYIRNYICYGRHPECDMVMADAEVLNNSHSGQLRQVVLLIEQMHIKKEKLIEVCHARVSFFSLWFFSCLFHITSEQFKTSVERDIQPVIRAGLKLVVELRETNDALRLRQREIGRTVSKADELRKV